ncbi:MAG: DUF4038 domain-containing protein, partial [bacterium]|nr:DUF4038 domain-containing protein [bacterium]
MRVLAMMALGLLASSAAGAEPPLTVSPEGVLLKDGAPCRGIGMNYFSVFSRRLAHPEDTSYRDGLRVLADHDVPFIRFMACGFWPVEMKLYQEDKETYFSYMDDVVATAEEVGIGLVPSLFWYWACVPDLVGEPCNQWGNPESKVHAFMRQYTREMVTRYRDSKAIWAWELGNEYNLPTDLPNAAEHRPWLVPNRGTPETRSDADHLRHDMLVTAVTSFAEEVRKHDPVRPITTGHSMPRASAHHQRMELSWTRDTRDEFIGNLHAVSPDPIDLLSVHVYPHARERRFGDDFVPFDDLIAAALEGGNARRKPVFIGEFGSHDDEEHGGRDVGRRNNLSILNAVERSDAPLAALWVFDLDHQESFINISPENHRSYLLDCVAHANRRIKLYEEGVHKVALKSPGLWGEVLDNEANRERSGSGFNPLMTTVYPGENLFRDDYVGLNFEHTFNGTAKDKDLARFTPRRDPCSVVARGPNAASVVWPSEGSSWGMACELRYELTDDACVDLEFSATPTDDRFPLGYAALMWASYMNHTRDRRIHFYGRDGDREGWVAFGEDTDDGFETGTVRCDGVEPVAYEDGADTLNLIEHPGKTFLLPFYYGLVDGDGDPATEDDTLAYVMMFDQTEPIR